MSEFEKLLSGGSKRKDVKDRQIKREKRRRVILWTLLISFIFTILPPFYWRNCFYPNFNICFFMREEWMG